MLLGVIYQLRLRQVAGQVRARMEERLEERERIARDLHDSLLQSVLGLILKFHAVATQMGRDEPAREALEKTLDGADEVLAEGRNRLRNLRATSIPFGGLPAAFERVAEETPQGADATFKTVVEGRVRELHPMVREECYWIGREAVVNALTQTLACLDRNPQERHLPLSARSYSPCGIVVGLYAVLLGQSSILLPFQRQ